ncbi:hypothetical protein ACFC4G_11040 [Streptomyces sp. NPDC056002]|uniref:hypothetical protein n=1 Tax=Streptomyces sp. NPDC056002 TaxID=3345675 RepID=UPI0035E2BF97
MVNGAGATRHRFTQLLGGARQEILIFPTEVAVAVDQESADPMVEDALRRGVAVRAGEPGAAGPTAEDRLILSLPALGFSDRKIAAQLDISLRTWECRLRSLMELAGDEGRPR